MGKGRGKVGILKMSLYGTRDVAVNFQKDVTKLMVSLGLQQAKYNASLYCRQGDGPGTWSTGAAPGGVGIPRKRNAGKISVLVHGDDFVATGGREDIAEFRSALRKRFTVKDKIVGSRKDLGEIAETRILNRIVRCTDAGWEYEADRRHAEVVVHNMNMNVLNQ